MTQIGISPKAIAASLTALVAPVAVAYLAKLVGLHVNVDTVTAIIGPTILAAVTFVAAYASKAGIVHIDGYPDPLAGPNPLPSQPTPTQASTSLPSPLLYVSQPLRSHERRQRNEPRIRPRPGRDPDRLPRTARLMQPRRKLKLWHLLLALLFLGGGGYAVGQAQDSGTKVAPVPTTVPSSLGPANGSRLRQGALEGQDGHRQRAGGPHPVCVEHRHADRYPGPGA